MGCGRSWESLRSGDGPSIPKAGSRVPSQGARSLPSPPGSARDGLRLLTPLRPADSGPQHRRRLAREGLETFIPRLPLKTFQGPRKHRRWQGWHCFPVRDTFWGRFGGFCIQEQSVLGVQREGCSGSLQGQSRHKQLGPRAGGGEEEVTLRCGLLPPGLEPPGCGGAADNQKSRWHIATAAAPHPARGRPRRSRLRASQAQRCAGIPPLQTDAGFRDNLVTYFLFYNQYWEKKLAHYNSQLIDTE